MASGYPEATGDHPGSIQALLPGDRQYRRRVLRRTLLRSTATTGGLLLLYAFVPIPERFGVGAVLTLIVALLAFVGLVGWQIRAIVGAENPLMRAIEVLAFAVPLLVVVFAFTYLALSETDPANFSEDLNRVDAMYYAVSTLCTVGFGDITAETSTARVLLTLQMIVDLALIGVLARLLVMATRTGVRRRVGVNAPEASE